MLLELVLIRAFSFAALRHEEHVVLFGKTIGVVTWGIGWCAREQLRWIRRF